MSPTFHPHPEMVLICDCNAGLKAPEMIKRRLVVVWLASGFLRLGGVLSNRRTGEAAKDHACGGISCV